MGIDNSDTSLKEEKTGNRLLQYAGNVFSQFGEDGIIEKIVSTLPVSKWCVEFGAWEGKHLSNTHLLLSQKGWSGVLIESDPRKFKELCVTYRGNERVTCVNRRVAFEGEDVLDKILAETPVPPDFDILSIDIDGNDYHVWKSLVRYRPKLVVIEFNNTIPNCVEFVQKADESVNQGSSLLALCRLGESKRYELIAVTDFNAFFVDADYFPLFSISDNSPETMNHPQRYVTHVFQLMDGTLAWSGNLKLLWHGIDMKPEKLQVLPRALRYFPETRPSFLRRYLFKLYRFLNP